ncbi:hypothetical protein HKD37_06G015003 [Glycine soja]|nr:hypothetical protein GmHk_06G015214 [Glycine max]
MGGFGVWMEASPSFEVEDDNEHCSTSATSSIGNDSDVLSETECGENDNEAHSTYKCHQPLDTMDSLQQVLPIRRGISKFYDGKSKSFTSLADAGSTPSVKDIAKPENAYTRRRRNLMWEKSRNYPLRSNNGGISKRTTISSSRSTVTLAFAINYDSNSSCASEDSFSSSNPSSSTASSSPMQHGFSSCWSFSLADIQNCSTAATVKMHSSSLGNEAAHPS